MDAATLAFGPAFQQEIVALMCGDEHFLGAFHAKVKGTFFSDPRHQTLVDLVLEHYRRHKGTPTPGLLEEAIRAVYPAAQVDHQEQRTKLWGAFEELPNVVGFTQLQRDTANAALRRWLVWNHLRMAVLETAKDLKANTATFDMSLVNRFVQAIQVGEDDGNCGVYMNTEAELTLQRALQGYRERVPTGITHLDQELGGGVARGELLIYLAPPKGFKSGTLICNASHFLTALSGSIVVYLTLELSEELQTLRYAINVTGTEKSEMFIAPDAAVGMFGEAFQKRIAGTDNDFYVRFFPPYVCTPGTVRRYLESLRQKHGKPIGALVVDYIDILGADGKHEKDYLAKTAVCTELRQIGVDFNCPVVTAARATREALGQKRISMKHMAGTLERVAIADWVYAICQTDSERAEGIARYMAVASRNEAGIKVVEAKLMPALMRIESVGSREPDESELDDGDGGGRKKWSKRDGTEEKKKPAPWDDESLGPATQKGKK